MTVWHPITPLEPRGTGMVVVWCHSSDWTRTASAEYVREGCRGGVFVCEGYEFTMFSYLQHPYPIPDNAVGVRLNHPKVLTEAQHAAIAHSVGPRAKTYRGFVNAKSGYYAGQLSSRENTFFVNPWTILLKTPDDAVLAKLVL